MADCHSGDAANSCPQPWSFLPGLSIIPWSQCLQQVLNGGTEPQRSYPTQLCYLASLSFSPWCWEPQISVSPCHHTPCGHLAWQGAVCCIFPEGSLMVWHTALSRCQPLHSMCSAAGSGPLVACWPLVPVSSCLHSMVNSCCSTLSFLFSYPKIKNQPHNQPESSQNLRWEALLRTEAQVDSFPEADCFFRVC